MKPEHDQDGSKIDATWGAMFAYAAGIDALGAKLEKKKTGARRIY